jgi:WD40 repeat protein
VAALCLVSLGVGAAYNVALQSSYHNLEEQQRQTEAALAQKETYLYLNRISLAEREWTHNNVGRVLELLDTCPEPRRGWEWNYFNRLCHSDRLVFRGHAHEVHTVAYHPGGEWIASGSADQTVKVWEARSGRVIHDLRGHHG